MSIDISTLSVSVKSEGIQNLAKGLDSIVTSASNAETRIKSLTANLETMLNKQVNSVATAAQKQVSAEADQWDKLTQQFDQFQNKRKVGIQKQIETTDTLNYTASQRAYSQAQAAAIKENVLFDKTKADQLAAEFKFRNAMQAQRDAEYADSVKAMDRQLKLNASYAAKSVTAQYNTAVRAQAYAGAGGDATSVFGSAAANATAEGIAKLKQQMEDAAHAAHTFSLANAGVTRELIVMGGELQRGNITKFDGSLTVLMNRMNVIPNLIASIGVAGTLGIGALAGIAAVLATAFFKGAAETDNYNKALILTGNYAGTSATGLRNMADQAVASSGSIGTAKTAVLELAQSGKFTSEEIAMISTTMTKMSDVAGVAIGETLKEFEKLAAEPSKALVELSEKYHFLTGAVLEQVLALEKQGDKEGAAALAEKEYSSAMDKRTEEIRANQGTMMRGWQDVRDWASKAWDAMLGIGRPIDANIAKLAEVNAKISAAKQQAASGSSATYSLGWGDNGLYVKNPNDELKKLLEERNKIQADMDAKANQEHNKAAMDRVNDANNHAVMRDADVARRNRSRKQIRDDFIAESEEDFNRENTKRLADQALANGKSVEEILKTQENIKKVAEAAGASRLEIAQKQWNSIVGMAAANGVTLVKSEQDLQDRIAAIDAKHPDKKVASHDTSSQVEQQDLIKLKEVYDAEVNTYNENIKHIDMLEKRKAETIYQAFNDRQAARDKMLQQTDTYFNAEIASLEAYGKLHADKRDKINKQEEQARLAHQKAVEKINDASDADSDKVYGSELKSLDTLVNSIDKAFDKEVKNLETATAKIKEHTKELGLTKAQVDALRAANEAEGTAKLESELAANKAVLAGIDARQAELIPMRDAVGVVDQQMIAQRALLETQIAGAEKLVAIQKENAQALRDEAIAQANADAAKKALQEWQKTASGIETAITNSIANGGQAGLKKIKEWAVNMLIQIPVQMVAQGMASMLYPGAAAASGGTGTVGSLMGAANNGSSLYRAYNAYNDAGGAGGIATNMGMDGAYNSVAGYFGYNGMGVSGATSSAAGGASVASQGLGSADASMAGYSGQTYAQMQAAAAASQTTGTAAAAGWTSAEGGAAYETGGAVATDATVAGGAEAAGGSSMIAAAGPYIAAAIVAYLAYKALSGGETRSGGGYNYTPGVTAGLPGSDVTYMGGPDGGEISSDNVKGAIKTTADSINSLLTKFGSTQQLDFFTAGLESSHEGKAHTFAGGTFGDGTVVGNNNDTATQLGDADPTKALAAFQTQLKVATIQSLQAANLGGAVGDYLTKLGDVQKLTAAQDDAVLAQINLMSAFIDNLKKLPFDNLKTASFDAVNAIANLVGGFGALDTKLASYYKNYYTAEEQKSVILDQVKTALDAVNLTMPTTRDEFRKLVNAQDLTTSSGQKAYAALLNVSDAFASVVSAADDAAVLKLQIQLMQLEGQTAAATALQRQTDLAAMSATQQSLQKQIYALQDADAAQKTYATTVANATAFIKGKTDDALKALQNSVSAQKTVLQTQYDAQLKAITDKATADTTAAQTQLTAAQTFSQNINTIFSALNSSLSTLVPMSYQAAQNLLQMAAAASNTGGDITSITGIQDALAVVNKPVADSYSSLLDMQKDQQITANAVSALQGNAKTQVDKAQLTIDALNATIKAISDASTADQATLKANFDAENSRLDALVTSAQEQVDAVRGVDNSVKSVEAALASFATALGAEKSLPAAIAANGPIMAGQYSDAGAFASMTAAGLSPDASQYASTQSGWSAYVVSLMNGLPSFDVGTNFVPSDMMAMIHQGERIVPAADNAELSRRLNTPQNNNSADIQELIQVIKSGDIATVQKTKEMADIIKRWNGEGMPATRST